jgi:putative hemolysin
VDPGQFILAAGALTGTQLAFGLGLILLLVVLSGMFSGSETVLFSLTPMQVERAANSANPFRRLVARLMARPKQTLLTILVANTAVNVLLFANSYVLFGRLAETAGPWVNALAGVGSVLLVVIGGEVVPKILGVKLAERVAPFSAAVVRGVGIVAGPVGQVVDWLIAEPFVRVVLGSPSHKAAETDLSPDELKTLLEMSRRSGVIDTLEGAFLRPIVDLANTRVRDIMVPRVEMTAYDINRPSAGLRELMRETNLRKVPVYEGNLDRIVGLVYAKVLFFSASKPLRQLVQPVRFVPELASGEQLLQHFRSTRTQLAIAVDEFGGVAGLVTLEDVIELIVGDLHDPEDELEAAEIAALADGQYEISGQMSVHYWVETFGLSTRVERVATVGGLVTSQLGRFAVVGDVVRLGNVELKVTQVQQRRIERLRLRLLEAEERGAA